MSERADYLPDSADYWSEIEDLTIFQAAYWMQIGDDPRKHERRCTENAEYCRGFNELGAYDIVSERFEVILSAIRAKLIAVTEKSLGDEGDFDPDQTRIRKSEWLTWCRGTRNPNLVELADRFDGKVAFVKDNSVVESKDLGWIAKARKLAQEIGEKRWISREQPITARNICDDVAAKLAEDKTTWGLQGQRGPDNVRVEGLRGWKFEPPTEPKIVD